MAVIGKVFFLNNLLLVYLGQEKSPGFLTGAFLIFSVIYFS
jgi:hypothetical protein